jgi:glycosyltransferase involved in cell wall biosynthesis
MMRANPRVLYLSQYFPPEVGATQERALEMARTWVRLGAEVTMVCEVPNHPAGVIAPAYRRRPWTREHIDGIEVIRVWVAASPRKSFVRRLAFYTSYMVHATLAGLLLARGPFDLIYATSPPLFVGGAALALGTLRRTPMVFEVRDLWPASAVAVGELASARAVRWAEALERACYRRAQRVVVVTEGARRHLTERGLSEHSLLLVPNGSDLGLFTFDPAARERLRAELALEDRVVLVYAGLHGLAQPLETLVEAMARLPESARAHLLMIGDGPRKPAIRGLVEELGIDSITMLQPQPREAMPAYLSAADLAVVAMRNDGVLDSTMVPVKIYDAWACGRPVLLSGGSAAAATIERAGGGVAVPPGDARQLADAVAELCTDPDGLVRMGEHGRLYTVAHHGRAQLAEGLWEKLLPLLSGARR